jgi:hypothetical protein
VALLRSNVEFAKRVFLDRLTTDAQPLLQPADIDAGPGDQYEYGGTFDPFNFGVGADCSGLCGIVLGAAINGNNGMVWARLFSTETFPGPLPGFRRTTQADLLSGNYPIKVMIMHGGGGPDSHMACWIDGWNMESNGDFGVCTMPPQITGVGSDFWNDWWVYGGPIIEDTEYRQPMSYPLGVDYAGGRPSGADLKAAGVSFVCRYLSDGGPGLPGKQLQPTEFADLLANGIQVVFNWETTADFMLGGEPQGIADAQTALTYVRSLPGMANVNPVIYFSADFDATPAEQIPINAYLQAAANILGGPQYVGIYGGYWPVSRALDAGVCKYAWQSEAWSGGNIDSRINIMQRNSLGYKVVAGVQCDINEAHSVDFGQYTGETPVPTPESNVPAIPKASDDLSQISELWDQLLIRWDMINGRTVVEALAEIGQKLSIPGYTPPSK